MRYVSLFSGIEAASVAWEPLECERLMGFPDGWTDIGEWVDDKGKRRKCADGNRYKALGNSMAVPVMLWIGTRIEMADMKVSQ